MTMPGLTLNTGAAAASETGAPQTPAASAATNANTTIPSAASTQAAATTPIPIPYAQHSSQLQNHQPPSRSSSPAGPTYSPITPPLNPTALPPRPEYTHSSNADATAAPAPRPDPIDFDSNPDVLALRSAISLLQIQRRRAERDMATLDRVKTAALAEPAAFVRDLVAGHVRVEGDRLFADGVPVEEGDSDSDSDSEDGSADEGMSAKQQQPLIHTEGAAQVADGSNKPAETTQPKSEAQPGPTIKPDPDRKDAAAPRPAWATLPEPQNVVRCPPINWSQYAVVGESLDRIHNEQLARPPQGVPAVMTPDGKFEFKAGDGGLGRQEKYVGVAAPYAPGKDRLDKKPKGPKR
ncbi:Uu.00g046300.m01.CDS01 [Anthostomella pinea]|uniref:Uu.00g046300.m01.CDS01 n=1 Tax=Anthostomella pinea TaxID=933095 RepID=A0AAI8VC10_9PEZI|nr:Uu.00g046300.m01.CDS01 [Anthostomella pinea]